MLRSWGAGCPVVVYAREGNPPFYHAAGVCSQPPGGSPKPSKNQRKTPPQKVTSSVSQGHILEPLDPKMSTFVVRVTFQKSMPLSSKMFVFTPGAPSKCNFYVHKIRSEIYQCFSHQLAPKLSPKEIPKGTSKRPKSSLGDPMGPKGLLGEILAASGSILPQF